MNQTARNSGAVRTVDRRTISTNPFSHSDHSARSMATSRLSLVACVLWLGVAASPVIWWLGTDRYWQIGYGIFSLVLSTAAASTACASIRVAWNGSCGPVRGWARH